MLSPLEPIFMADRLFPLHAELMPLLRGLDRTDWNRPTTAGEWSVRDVAAHLLDGDIRKLSICRDGHPPPAPDSPLDTYGELTAYLDRLNADWIRAARRISPPVLIELLDATGRWVAAYFQSLDPFAPAMHPVAWAGEQTSPNWFDTAREYTERWHHQEQIREAVGAPGLTAHEWLHPAINISVRALPFAYRDIDAETGTTVCFDVGGEAGGVWSLVRESDGWTLYSGNPPTAACRVRMDAETAGRLLLHRLPAEQAAARIEVEGDERLGSPVLRARAVMV